MRFQDINDYILDDIFDIVEKKELENKQEFYRKNAFKRCMDDLLNPQGRYNYYHTNMTLQRYNSWLKDGEKRLILYRLKYVFDELLKITYIKSQKYILKKEIKTRKEIRNLDYKMRRRCFRNRIKVSN